MRHVRAALKAQVNKTDPSDARGIAQMMRAGLYRPVHVKTLRSPKLRTLLTHRKLLRASVETDLRATLSNFGLKVGMVGTARFETRVKELVENLPDLAARAEPLFILRRVLHEQIDFLHRRLHGQRLEAGPAPTGPTVRLRSPRLLTVGMYLSLQILSLDGPVEVGQIAGTVTCPVRKVSTYASFEKQVAKLGGGAIA
jgi:hypothetical protein